MYAQWNYKGAISLYLNTEQMEARIFASLCKSG